MSALLEVAGLRVEFKTEDGPLTAVADVGFTIEVGETVALVGESGSGKTVTAMSVMGLVSRPGRIVAGDIRFEGRPLVGLAESEYRTLRGGDLAMIFQDPLSSLNPSFRVGDQVAEALLVHQHDMSRPRARERAAELLALVGIPQAPIRARDYPHQLSGGMRQRVMIAMAIANGPKLLIADEPTTALDVTIQAQVLEVLDEAKREANAAMMLITHDLGIVAGVADRVIVMYAGRVVEQGTLDEIFYESRHPYTLGLLSALPRLDSDRSRPLDTIRGAPPGRVLPPGCALHPRCPYEVERCREERPELRVVGSEGHRSACFRAEELTQVVDA